MSKQNIIADALSSIKGIFSAVAKMTFSEAVQEDGTTIQYGTLEVGATVFVSDGEESTPAPNGEYKIDASTSIVVEDGKITEVLSTKEDAPEVAVEADEDTPAEDVQTEVEDVIEGVPTEPSIEDVLAALVATQKAISDKLIDFEARITALEGSSASKSDVDALQEGFAKLAKTPVQKSKTNLKGLENNDSKNQMALQSVFAKFTK